MVGLRVSPIVRAMFVAATVLLGPLSGARGQCTAEPLGRIGGVVTHVANLSGDRAAIATGGRLEILNVATGSFTRLSRISFDPEVVGFAGGSNLLAVATPHPTIVNGPDTIHLFNVSTNTPVAASTLTGFGSVHDMVVANPYLHLVHDNGYSIYNISNPASPVLLGGLSALLSGPPQTLAVAGFTAYMASDDRVLVVDWTDPASPVVHGFWEPTDPSPEQSNVVKDIAYGGSNLYTATRYGLVCLDVSNPVNPSVVSVFAPDRNFTNVVARGLTVMAATSDAAADLVNYATPASPTAVTTSVQGIATMTGPPTRVWCTGSFGMQGYTIVSQTSASLYGEVVRAPEQPTLLVVDANESFAYCATDNRIASVSISTPSTPVLFNEGVVMPHSVIDLDISGNTLLVAGAGKVTTVNVSQALTPTVLDTETYSGADGSVVVVKSPTTTLARAVLGGQSIRVIEFGTPSNIILRGSLALSGQARAVLPVGGWTAFVTAAGRISAIDVTNPVAPVLRSSLIDPDVTIEGLAASGTYLYAVTRASNQGRRVRVIDTSDPAAMTVVGESPEGWNAIPPFPVSDVAIYGNQLYVVFESSFSRFVERFDVQLPNFPRIVENIEVSHGGAKAIAVTSQAVIAAESWAGLRTYSRPTQFRPWFTIQPEENETCWQGTIPFPDYAFYGQARGVPSATYTWYRNGVLIPGETSPILRLSTPQTGSATFTIRATNACGFTESSAHLFVCVGDFDCSGAVGVPDIFAFLSAWFAQSPSAEVDGNAGITVPDIFAFLSAWFAGCP